MKANKQLIFDRAKSVGGERLAELFDFPLSINDITDIKIKEFLDENFNKIFL